MAEGPVGSAHLSGESGPQQRSANFGSIYTAIFCQKGKQTNFFPLKSRHIMFSEMEPMLDKETFGATFL